MRHPLLLGLTALRLRISFRNDGMKRKKINVVMDRFTSDVFESAVAKADTMTGGKVSRALAEGDAHSKGSFGDFLNMFFMSELGKFLLDLLKTLLLGLISGGVAGGVTATPKEFGGAMGLVSLFFLLVFGSGAFAADYPKPVIADPLPVVVKSLTTDNCSCVVGACDCIPDASGAGKCGCVAFRSEYVVPKVMAKATTQYIGDDHNCPYCSRHVTTVYHEYNGTHSHFCPIHGELMHPPGHDVKQQTFSFTQSSGCASGACSNGSCGVQSQGWRPGKLLFGR